MSVGRIIKLDCGHNGEAIVGTFGVCDVCDGKGKPRCPRCRSYYTEPFRVDAFSDVWHCGESNFDGHDGCGHVFQYKKRVVL